MRPRGVDAVVTMLPAGKDTLAVWGGGMLEAAAPGTLIIDSSTIDVASARAAHKLAGAAKHALARRAGVGRRRRRGGGDADLHGRRQPRTAFDKAKPILECMGKRVVHCGEAGAGQAAKICNNMMLGISMIGVCEAFVLAEKLGLSHQALFEVASSSSGQCWSLTNYCPVPGPVPSAPVQQQLQAGLCLGAHAQGPQAGAGGGRRRRRHHAARRRRRADVRRCTTPGARAAPTSPASSI